MGGAAKPGKDTVDYADKHWSGLIGDYYKKRVEVVMQQAVSDAKAGRKLDTVAVDLAKAQLGYEWTTAQNKYPTSPVGDAVVVSQKMHDKYKDYFATCSPIGVTFGPRHTSHVTVPFWRTDMHYR